MLLGALAEVFRSIPVCGWLLAAGGTCEAIAAFAWAKERRGLWLHLPGALVGAAVGEVIMTGLDAAAQAPTIIMASLLLAGGLFPVCAAVVLRFPYWVWVAVGSATTAVLGTIICSVWLVPSRSVLGTVISLELAGRGAAWVMLTFVARSPSNRAESPTDGDLELVTWDAP